MDSTVYGASLAGGTFDIWTFIKRPQTITQLLSSLFSIIVFATIDSKGHTFDLFKNDTKCIFNENNSACQFGVAIGVLAFVTCVVFIVLDVFFHNISNANDRRLIVLGFLILSALGTFLWFVCFTVLTSQWNLTTAEGFPVGAAHTVLTFSFFSIVSWGALTIFAFQRYNQGLDSGRVIITDQDNSYIYPPIYPTGMSQSYYQSPFTTDSAEGGFQSSSY